MLTRKIRLALHILMYLMLFVGILYVAMYVIRAFTSSVDGFATTLQPLTDPGGATIANCKFITKFGQDIVLCENVDAANQYLDVLKSGNFTIPTTTQICYTDSNDGGLLNSSNAFYVCFQRPEPMIFDTNTNQLRRQDAIFDGDSAPDSAREDVVGVCSGYQGLMANITSVYTSTGKTSATVNGIQASTVYILDQMRNLSTTYCGNVTTPSKQNACNTIGQSIQNFISYSTDRKMNTVKNGLNGALENIQTLSNSIANSFKNSGCVFTPAK